MRPGCSAVTSSGSGAVSCRHQDVDGRHPEGVADQVAAVTGLSQDEARLAALDLEPAGEAAVVRPVDLGVQVGQLLGVVRGLPAVEQQERQVGHGAYRPTTVSWAGCSTVKR